eukprot:4201731-Alexandrium_andersonii.AAC.1
MLLLDCLLLILLLRCVLLCAVGSWGSGPLPAPLAHHALELPHVPLVGRHLAVDLAQDDDLREE